MNGSFYVKSSLLIYWTIHLLILPTQTFSRSILLKLNSSIDDVIIATATRGRCLKRNILNTAWVLIICLHLWPRMEFLMRMGWFKSYKSIKLRAELAFPTTDQTAWAKYLKQLRRGGGIYLFPYPSSQHGQWYYINTAIPKPQPLLITSTMALLYGIVPSSHDSDVETLRCFSNS